jgi:hypothetical protein
MGHLRRDSVEAFKRGQKSQLIGSVNIVRIKIEHDEEDVDGDRVSKSGINVVLSRVADAHEPGVTTCMFCYQKTNILTILQISCIVMY